MCVGEREREREKQLGHMLGTPSLRAAKGTPSHGWFHQSLDWAPEIIRIGIPDGGL